eukprot:221039_1
MLWALVKYVSTFGHAPKSAPRQQLCGAILVHYCIDCESKVNDIIFKEKFYCLGADGFSKDTIKYLNIMNIIRDEHAFITACIPCGANMDTEAHLKMIMPLVNRWALRGCKMVGFIDDCGGPMPQVKSQTCSRIGGSRLSCVSHFSCNGLTLLYKTMKIKPIIGHICKFISTFYNHSL